jgi:hypothetical protein
MDHNQVLQPVSMDPSPCVDDFRKYSPQELREHLGTIKFDTSITNNCFTTTVSQDQLHVTGSSLPAVPAEKKTVEKSCEYFFNPVPLLISAMHFVIKTVGDSPVFVP